MEEKIREANSKFMEIIKNAKPVLIDIATAIDVIPNYKKNLILHAGPPIKWEDMSGPLKGAVVGGLIYEGLASDFLSAEEIINEGKIEFDSCHHYNSVGPMAGVITASMPVFVVKNESYDNYAYCTLNEGLGKVLRYGAYDEEVIEKLEWMKTILAPVLKEALDLSGKIELKAILAQMLQMGDEGHNRNKAGTSLFIREMAPFIVKTKFNDEEKSDVLAFINSNDHFFLNISMPICKCTLDPASNIKYSTLVYAMARNGTEFGIRVSGLGERWFTAPAEVIDGLFFSAYTKEDANPDIGDSVICETLGIGGFSMAAALPIVKFVGGTTSDALDYSRDMYEITEGESDVYKIPVLDFKGIPTGIDIKKVIETGILPIINTGIAHKEPGIGQVGAGLVRPPMECFEDALVAFVEETCKKED